MSERNKLPEESTLFGGVIAWMVDNKVTPNLLMVCLIIGGFLSIRSITQEVFPAFELDRISISVSYPRQHARRDRAGDSSRDRAGCP